MNKIMLCCSAGMSTSILVKKMKAEAEKRHLEVEISAFGATEFDEQVGHYDVVLLGPQVKYMQPDLQSRATVPVEVIKMTDYGMQNGSNVLDYALELIAN